MAWRGGSLSRSVFFVARTMRSGSSLSSISGIPCPASPSLRSNLFRSRRPLRTMGQLGRAQSPMPLHSAAAITRLTSRIAVESRACCELSQGT